MSRSWGHPVAALLAVALAAAAGAAGAAEACDPVPEALVAPPEALVARTRVIALAEAMPLPPGTGTDAATPASGSTDPRRRMLESGDATERTLIAAGFRTLRVIEYLKGDGPEFVMTALLPAGTSPSPDFDGHRDPAFWARAGEGRARIGPECRLRGDFATGERYLVFLGTPHVKGFERVAAEDDAWLAWVRERLADVE
jgi:hypothetical protein